jgi:hypothetical protein
MQAESDGLNKRIADLERAILRRKVASANFVGGGCQGQQIRRPELFNWGNIWLKGQSPLDEPHHCRPLLPLCDELDTQPYSLRAWLQLWFDRLPLDATSVHASLG